MARRPSDVPPKRVRELDAGHPSANLAESLAVDFAKLMQGALPEMPSAGVGAMRSASGEGYTKRMAIAASLALKHLGQSSINTMSVHPSDTVRGWACYAIGTTSDGIEDAIERIRPLAADAHFGVREWAWLGIRVHIVADPTHAIDLLTPWSLDADANMRRFASEATRPRGVWCAHIAELKDDPDPALPLLEPLSADPEKYVQDSVANWLNDASKTRPDWVERVCDAWQAVSPGEATARICRRALRTIRKA